MAKPAPTQLIASNGAADDSQWAIDCDITMREKRAFTQTITTINPTNGTDEAALYPFFAKVVKAWPYVGDPANVEVYDDLKISQLQEVTRRVMAAFQQLTNGTG